MRRGREQRHVSRCRVEFDRPSGTVEAETEDISAKGVFIRTEALLPVGEVTAIRITLPDDTVIAMSGRVAHMLTPSSARAVGRHPGMGFELLGADTPSHAKLREHIAGLRRDIATAKLSTTTQAIIVEPSAPLRSRMERCLEGAGFKLAVCVSATDALERCKARQPDVIVCASKMDGVGGIDLAYAMADHGTLSSVPLVLTGDDSDLNRLEAFRAGIRDYIPKPFLDEELVIRVHRVVSVVASRPNLGLRGNLVDIGLGTLLSLFEFERKSGVLLLLRDGDIARIFLSEGKPLKVEANTGTGPPKQRMMQLLDWRTGHFEFSPSAVGGRDELQATITQILLEHARHNDETNANRTARAPGF